MLAARGYGPVEYWFNMSIGELSEWLEAIKATEKK